MNIFCLVVAILVSTIGNLVRVMRWKMFIEIYEKPSKRSLLQALSIGYILNEILPYKMGELFRAWFSGKNMKTGPALGFSTVIVERYMDILVVGVIFGVLSVSGGGDNSYSKAFFMYFVIAVSVLTVTGVVWVLRGFVKRMIRFVAGIFAPKIEMVILKFSWALISSFKDIFRKIHLGRFFIRTFLMWGLYILSYYMFAISTVGFADDRNMSWQEVFSYFFMSNGLFGGFLSRTGYRSVQNVLAMLSFVFIPSVLIFVISFLFSKRTIVEEDIEYLNLFPHLSEDERLGFLEGYFANKNREYVKNYLKINQGITIVRDYSAGSNATTMLCMDGNKTFFRKYAFGADGDKLYEQIIWLDSNKGRLKLPEVLKFDKTDIYCYYDMPYRADAVGLFEYVHSMPAERGWNIMRNVLQSLEESIYLAEVRQADNETVGRYIEAKVENNLNAIRNAKQIGTLLQYDSVIINGVEYPNLQYYEKFLTKESLEKVFKMDNYAVIHGDLTVENIICIRTDTGEDDFYIIDPNTGNVHDSPNLDYGKLLQSIHGGYEFLMATKDVHISENRIDFLFTRSSAYAYLHDKLRNYMLERFGTERTKSIYYHEIIHWLRLMPYKIERDGKRAVIFYAGLLIVMHDVIKMFEEK